MKLATAHYSKQEPGWPKSGQHILAHYDTESIIVYQAYRPSIGRFAIEHGHFGGDFSYSRMSWIKSNFLWMMYRSGWGTKKDQEITLGLRIGRPFFDSILAEAVASTLDQSNFVDRADWQTALKASEVRLQWDPDHGPNGASLSRRAVQLGLRGSVLQDYGTNQLLEVIDMTAFVEAQRLKLAQSGVNALMTPIESIYTPDDIAAANLSLD